MSPDARTRVGNFGGFRWLALAFVLHGVNGIAGVVGPAFISDERTSPFGLAGMSRVERPVGGRFVKVNPGLSEMARVSLDVAPGIRLEAERIRLDRFQGRDFVWVGRLVGEPLSEVVLASRDGVLAGVIDRPVVDGNVVHAITPPDGGGSVLAEYDPVEAGRVDCRTLEPSVDGGRRARRGLLGTRNLAPSATYPAATAENPAVVDVMVVYTPATTTRHGGAPGVEALILQAVSSANTAYQNSGVHQALNLVAMSEVPYVEPGDMSITLTRLSTPGDSHLNTVHGLREACGADIVVLMDQDANYCGISYQMGTPNVSFAASAFCVINSGCIANYSLTHDVAHLMGSQHERESAFGTPSFPYSYGYKRCTTDGTGFRTVMGYACTGAVVPRVNFFSNPSVAFNGFPTGVPYATDPANASDNARSLNETAFHVAGFRTRPDTVPGPRLQRGRMLGVVRNRSGGGTDCARPVGAVGPEPFRDSADVAGSFLGRDWFPDRALRERDRFRVPGDGGSGRGHLPRPGPGLEAALLLPGLRGARQHGFRLDTGGIGNHPVTPARGRTWPASRRPTPVRNRCPRRRPRKRLATSRLMSGVTMRFARNGCLEASYQSGSTLRG